jgi:hypothetical protein
LSDHRNQVSEHLPYQPRWQLIRASLTPVTNGDMLARVRAIDQARDDIKAQYPEFFKEEIKS